MIDQHLYAGKTYDEVIDEFSDTVTRVCALRCRKIEDVKDCYQNVFLKLFLSKTEFKSAEHLRSWLIKVSVTTSIDCVKQYWNKNVFLHGNDKETMQILDVLCFQQNEKSGINNQESDTVDVLNDIFKLPVKYRQVIFLYYFEEYNLSEISTLLNIPEGTIKSQLARGRKLLKNKLESVEPIVSKGGMSYENSTRV